MQKISSFFANKTKKVIFYMFFIIEKQFFEIKKCLLSKKVLHFPQENGGVVLG